jgi:hypothetical protein
MKVRIKGNSIRLRLSKTDVTQLCHTGLVHEATQIGTATFHYELKVAAAVAELDASYSEGTITVYISSNLIVGWDDNNTIGFSHHKPMDGEGTLFLLVEKDFKCIDAEVLEDQSDNYEHPTNSCA